MWFFLCLLEEIGVVSSWEFSLPLWLHACPVFLPMHIQTCRDILPSLVPTCIGWKKSAELTVGSLYCAICFVVG